ncbi:MAG TPA: GNAT family N-acetyltransferase [Chitinophagaceae bacterium]|jgi:GNAT superfamily N-acetyltransferase|nr:GNAT family N-acetyltransferase [Chitinophagaceae bacterium]
MNITIIPYSNEHHSIFKQLNLEWLDKYNLTESHDLMVLDDPTGTILDRGGFIWLAKAGDEIVGSAALMNEGHGIFELAKMCVAKGWQGKGISKILIETCLKKAKETGAKKLTLFSNHQLQTALKLYEKYGFKNVEVKDSPFETADVKMELEF